MANVISYGRFYHIYNRGNNSETVFLNDADYNCFLKLSEIYLTPVADILSWCLMKNHFHLLIRVKELSEIGYLNPEFTNSADPELKWKTTPNPPTVNVSCRKPVPWKQLKHFFSSFAIYINNHHNRTGSILEKAYERKLIEDENYLRELVLYINNNPVKHGLCKNHSDYYWSSYNELVLKTSDSLTNPEYIIKYFDSIENFCLTIEQYKKKNC